MSMTSFFEQHGSKIEYGTPTGCWLWNAGADKDGYGKAQSKGATQRAHRLAYEAVHGDGTADGLLVRHRCDTPACVNPDHLETGTPADNSLDRVERGRSPKGAKNGRAKVSEDDVRAIRASYIPQCREFGQYALARRFGLSRPVVGFILSRKTWGHL